MLKNIRITVKFPLIIITFALVSALMTGLIAYTKTKKSMEHSAQERLVSLLESRQSSLHHFFDDIIHHVESHAQNPIVINAIKEFATAWNTLGNTAYTSLPQQYVSKTSNILQNTPYRLTHNHLHSSLKNMMELSSFYDLFLIDPQGNIIYTSEKEADFATNLLSGPWKTTYLAKLFRTMNQNPNSKVQISDFSPYEPSNNEPASFIGRAIFDKNNTYLGVLIFQMPIEPIDTIMHVTAGMGESGETYIVGPDSLMRSNSRFLKERSILKTTVNSISVKQGMEGNSGVEVVLDYRGIPVYSVFMPFKALTLNWVILAEMDEAEVLAPVHDMGNFLLFSGLLITIVVFVIGYLLSFDISRPIVSMTKIMNNLSNDNLQITIPIANRRDEIGQMADAMKVFKKNAIERNKLQNELIKISEIDSLTGIFTRKYIMDKFEHYITNPNLLSNKKLVVMFIDLDDFKSINDKLGHDMGDQALCSIAQYLQDSVRQGDIVARIGGDEFIILFPNIESQREVYPIAQKILASIQKDSLPISVSMGLSIYPDNAQCTADLLKQADTAMYNVKSRGKNNFAFWSPDTVQP